VPTEPAAPKISPAIVARQLVALSLLVWVVTVAIALIASAVAGWSVSSALLRSCLLMAVVVLAGGTVSLARGPVPMDRGAGQNLIRPLGALSRAGDSFLRPRPAADDAAPAGGLTGFGAAVLVAAELIAVAILI
jgi:hypothetical protein